MIHKAFLGSAALVAAVGLAPAKAEGASQDGFGRIGISYLKLADKGPIFVNGVRNPTAGYRTPEKYPVSGTLGYFVAPRLALELSATTPVSTDNVPAGSLAGIPNLGSDRFSIFAAAASFHPLRGRTVSPYVGAGIAFQKVWSTRDGAGTNLRVHDAHGPVIQAGVDVALARQFGVFAEVKKHFYSAHASTDLGPAHVTAVAKLNPLLAHAGAFFRY